jgi:hypothetical protein
MQLSWPSNWLNAPTHVTTADRNQQQWTSCLWKQRKPSWFCRCLYRGLVGFVSSAFLLRVYLFRCWCLESSVLFLCGRCMKWGARWKFLRGFRCCCSLQALSRLNIAAYRILGFLFCWSNQKLCHICRFLDLQLVAKALLLIQMVIQWVLRLQKVYSTLWSSFLWIWVCFRICSKPWTSCRANSKWQVFWAPS